MHGGKVLTSNLDNNLKKSVHYGHRNGEKGLPIICERQSPLSFSISGHCFAAMKDVQKNFNT